MEWNLKLIYENEELFENDLASLEDIIKNIEGLKGKLNNKDGFKEYAKYSKELDLKLDNLYTYANMNYDLNQKDINSGKRYQRVYTKYMDLISRLSFVDPELLKNKYEDMLSWCENDKELKPLTFYVKKLFRGNKHVKTAKIEEIMSRYNDSTSGYSNLYDKLLVADGKSVNVTLEDGNVIEVNSGNYTYYLGSLEKQEDRKKVFEAYYKQYENHKTTLAAIYKGVIAGEYAESKNRGYKSILESHLFNNNIDKRYIYL